MPYTVGHWYNRRTEHAYFALEDSSDLFANVSQTEQSELPNVDFVPGRIMSVLLFSIVKAALTNRFS